MVVSLHADGRILAEPIQSAANTWVHDPDELLGRNGLTGPWRHFKGGRYRFLGRAETEGEPLLIYLDATDEVWARPESMVCEEVDRAGYRGPRFVPEPSMPDGANSLTTG